MNKRSTKLNKGGQLKYPINNPAIREGILGIKFNCAFAARGLGVDVPGLGTVPSTLLTSLLQTSWTVRIQTSV